MQIQNLSPGELTPYAFNNKRHDTKQISLIVDSITNFGFVQPIVADKDKVVIIGHARLAAAKQMKLKSVPVVILEDIDEVKARKLRLLDNRLSDFGEYDLDNIRMELEAIGDAELTELFDGLDLYKDETEETSGQIGTANALFEKFGIPPFSVLDTRQGYWLDRKKLWKDIILNEGKTREDQMFLGGDTKVGGKISEIGTVSIFDPVLAEILVKWFCPKDGKVFDTFAGGASGFVYSYLGHEFTGIELRQDQADINNQRLLDEGLQEKSRYICDDGQNIAKHLEKESHDFFFSCPPYFDLEVYSDDPRDASNQKNYEEFRKILENAFTGAASILKNNRFAAIVMSNVRDSKGFYIDIVGDIKKIMEKNGLRLYNDIILVNTAGSAPLRANGYMKSRKVARTHQNVMVFYKGDTAATVHEKNGFELMDFRQTIQFHEDVLVFYKGDPKQIAKEFPEMDFSNAEGMDEAITDSIDE